MSSEQTESLPDHKYRDKRVLVTGAAGFIGFSLSRRLLAAGANVIGLDCLNEYYDVNLKRSRLEILAQNSNFEFVKEDLINTNALLEIFAKHRFDFVFNLAAQAGVRHSLKKPMDYVDSNLVGFVGLLEGCRHHEVKHFVFASSSSVYGLNTTMPFSVHDNVDHPVSLYAASKKANELMAHSYAHLYALPVTGLRFFTVYGPWGRPDMALFLFASKMLRGEPIDVYNNGDMMRDFTYIDDIVDGVCRVGVNIPSGNSQWSSDAPDPATSPAPYQLYNIGNNDCVTLMEFVHAIERALDKKATINYMPMQPGDVRKTSANIDSITRDTGFAPRTSLEDGIAAFISWYREYYGE